MDGIPHSQFKAPYFGKSQKKFREVVYQYATSDIKTQGYLIVITTGNWTMNYLLLSKQINATAQ